MREQTPLNTGDRLVRAGGIVFVVGAVATLVTVAPLLLGTTPFPVYMFCLSMLMGVGFLIAAAGVLTSAAAGRREAREAQEARAAAAAQAASGSGVGAER
ncbi:hypothetical protein ABT026_07060 [Streptomyces sp. NPDC002734]|uniref:hypothetical protein n=1 Tax=unclassified Streptomyces TaxID=2593676 RepID=UPI00332FDA6D